MSTASVLSEMAHMPEPRMAAARSMEQAPVPPWAPATVTIGLAVYPDDGLTLPELVLRADERLYAGKRQGGARLVTSSSAERS